MQLLYFLIGYDVIFCCKTFIFHMIGFARYLLVGDMHSAFHL
jgi:hypothetical protein